MNGLASRSALVLALLLALPIRVASADEAVARAQFKKGVELYDHKKYAEALTAFQEAYREKPSAGIKQNIALSLKGLGRLDEAATSLDEALDEGKDSLKPETRAAIERELATLAASVSTVTLVVEDEQHRPVEGAVVTIAPSTGKARKVEGQRRPIRLMPGTYAFSARAPGFADPPEKKLALESGPLDVTFVFRKEGSAAVAAAPVAAAQAHREVPGEYMAPKTEPVKWKRAYVVLAGGLDTVSYRLGVPLGEPFPYGTRRSNFGGLSLGARFGYFVTKRFAIEGLLEVGGMGAKYKRVPADPGDTETKVVHWQLTPMLRFASPGKVRFIAGTGFGVHGLGVESKLGGPGPEVTKKGAGVGFSWMSDAGLAVDLGSVFLEFALFLNVHGVGPVRDETPPESRLLYASPATRGGLRAGVGIPF